MIRLVFVFIFLLLALEGNALDKKYYIKGDAGISAPGEKMKQESGYLVDKRARISPQFSLGAGYNVTPQVRLDVTSSHITDLKYSGSTTTTAGQELTHSQKIKANTFILNAYYHLLEHIIPSPLFSPFIGVGVGVSRISHNISSITSSDTAAAKVLREMKPSTNLVFGGTAGISTIFTDNLSLEWCYKYIYMGKYKGFHSEKTYVDNTLVGQLSLDTKKSTFSTHSATIGIRYNF